MICVKKRPDYLMQANIILATSSIFMGNIFAAIGVGIGSTSLQVFGLLNAAMGQIFLTASYIRYFYWISLSNLFMKYIFLI